MSERAARSELTVMHVRAALAGDVPAVVRLIEIITPVVQTRIARALLRRPRRMRRDLAQEVADLTQEVFVTLFSDDAKSLRAWEPSRGLSLVNFVGLLAERRVASLLRARSSQVGSEELAGENSHVEAAATSAHAPDTLVMSRRTLEALMDALRTTLSPRGLELFHRLYVDEQSVGDVCAATGLNSAAVYQWKHRLAQATRAAFAALQADTRCEPASERHKPQAELTSKGKRESENLG